MSAEPGIPLLSKEESATRFTERIVPQRFAGGISQEHPVLDIVAGQPGAGKSSAEKRACDNRGPGTVIIDADILRTYHPAYQRLVLANDRLAATLTHPEAQRWVQMAKEHCIAHRYNVLLSATMGSPASAGRTIAQFRKAGYQVHLAVLAAHEATSQLNVLTRYQKGRDRGSGRHVPLEVQREAYTGLLDTVDLVDAGCLVDAVQVYQRPDLRRWWRQVYWNELGRSGCWVRPPETRAEVVAARNRPWGPEQIADFSDRGAALSGRLSADLHSDLLSAARAAQEHLAISGEVLDTSGWTTPPA